jgi:hypothetical protein
MQPGHRFVNRATVLPPKRSQRASKFLLLIDTFGMSVLNCVPQVSVSRVDVLRMEESRLLADGLCMKTEVESIRQKQDSSGCRVSGLTEVHTFPRD